MNILFTGASSFSGMWFVKELAHAGHAVTAIFKRPLDAYDGLRRKRIEQIIPLCTPIYNTSFGDDQFLSAAASKPWDIFCHHAADVTNYRSPDFNVANALAANTFNLKTVLATLKQTGCRKVLLTGSVFEQNEGSGCNDLRAVSPYGLSKGLTAETFAYYTAIMEMKLAKFVIPNPFGAYEEGRFTSYLAQTWLKKQSAAVNSPLYERDNIPVDLLAKAYVSFASDLDEDLGFQKFNPSFYMESQGSFTHRFAQELSQRFALPCRFDLKNQVDFSEPLTRVNTNPIDWQRLGWDEKSFWDELATFYQTHYASRETENVN